MSRRLLLAHDRTFRPCWYSDRQIVRAVEMLGDRATCLNILAHLAPGAAIPWADEVRMCRRATAMLRADKLTIAGVLKRDYRAGRRPRVFRVNPIRARALGLAA